MGNVVSVLQRHGSRNTQVSGRGQPPPTKWEKMGKKLPRNRILLSRGLSTLFCWQSFLFSQSLQLYSQAQRSYNGATYAGKGGSFMTIEPIGRASVALYLTPADLSRRWS